MHACVRLLACCVSERIRASVSLLGSMLDIIKSKLMASMAAPSNSIISILTNLSNLIFLTLQPTHALKHHGRQRVRRRRTPSPSQQPPIPTSFPSSSNESPPLRPDHGRPSTSRERPPSPRHNRQHRRQPSRPRQSDSGCGPNHGHQCHSIIN